MIVVKEHTINEDGTINWDYPYVRVFSSKEDALKDMRPSFYHIEIIDQAPFRTLSKEENDYAAAWQEGQSVGYQFKLAEAEYNNQQNTAMNEYFLKSTIPTGRSAQKKLLSILKEMLGEE